MADRTRITVSLVPSPLTGPLLDGSVKVEGVELEPNASKTVDANSRAMLEGKYDVAEMSLATYLRAKETGAPLIGLPVFPGRRFPQPGAAVRRGSGIKRPRELAGKRVGLPQYWLTSSVWHRGVLQHEYGVAPKEVDWVTVVPERGAAEFPQGVRVTSREGATLPALLDAGEIDAALGPRPVEENCLFPDVAAEQREYLAHTGIFPIMHFIVLRESLAGLAPNLMRAFAAVKQRATPEPPIYGMSVGDGLRVFGGDAYPYGLGPNRKVLDTFLGYAHEQGLTRKKLSLDALFVEA
jgi:4,5-dihydroxyphthalate decarboxylase